MLIIPKNEFPNLETERLVLNEQTEDDINEIFRLRSDPKVMRYIDRIPATNLEEAQKFLSVIQESQMNGLGLCWGIRLKESAKLIGNIGYWRMLPEHFRGEIGYALLPEYHQQGIMHEALHEVLNYGFTQMNLHTVMADINPENNASRALLLKTGFKREAYFKENFFFNGKFLDSEIFGIVKTDYLK